MQAPIVRSALKRDMRQMPALFIRISIFPNLSITLLIMESGAERTSPAIVRIGVPYLVVISEASFSRSGDVRARTARGAPDAAKARAVVRPIPREAPVMGMTLPVREAGLLRKMMKG
jgi:hypothetical protein